MKNTLTILYLPSKIKSTTLETQSLQREYIQIDGTKFF